jgi:hypothetical protein
MCCELLDRPSALAVFSEQSNENSGPIKSRKIPDELRDYELFKEIMLYGVDWLFGSLVSWLIGWLVGLLIDWLVGWLVG